MKLQPAQPSGEDQILRLILESQQISAKQSKNRNTDVHNYAYKNTFAYCIVHTHTFYVTRPEPVCLPLAPKNSISAPPFELAPA